MCLFCITSLSTYLLSTFLLYYVINCIKCALHCTRLDGSPKGHPSYVVKEWQANPRVIQNPEGVNPPLITRTACDHVARSHPSNNCVSVLIRLRLVRVKLNTLLHQSLTSSNLRYLVQVTALPKQLLRYCFYVLGP